MNDWDTTLVGKQVLYCLDKMSLKQALLKIEKQVISEALRICNGNCADAAHILGMKRTTLVAKRRRHGLLGRRV